MVYLIKPVVCFGTRPMCSLWVPGAVPDVSILGDGNDDVDMTSAVYRRKKKVKKLPPEIFFK